VCVCVCVHSCESMREDSHDRKTHQLLATAARHPWPRHGCMEWHGSMECRWRLSIVCIRLPLSAARCKVVKPLGSLACTSVTCMRVLSSVASALFFAEDNATTTSSSSTVLVRSPCQRDCTLFCVVVRVRVQLKSAVLGVTHVVEAVIVSRALGDELSATTAILRMRSLFDLFCVPRDTPPYEVYVEYSSMQKGCHGVGWESSRATWLLCSSSFRCWLLHGCNLKIWTARWHTDARTGSEC